MEIMKKSLPIGSRKADSLITSPFLIEQELCTVWAVMKYLKYFQPS